MFLKKALQLLLIFFISFVVAKSASAAITIRPALVFSTGGSITISSSKNINTDTLAAGRSCADGGDGVAYSVTALSANTATLSVSPASGCLSANDRMMLINLQADGTNLTNVGNYEFLVVGSVTTNTVTFTANKIKYYGNGAADDTNIGTSTTKQRVILQRVPQYMDVTILSGGTLTASGWDGVKGGVLAFYASGKVEVQSGGIIDMSGKGYRSTGTHSSQGESYNGVGTMLQTSNLGGGGGDYNYDDYECHYDQFGAGGGGYGAAGSEGWSGQQAGDGGVVYGNANLDKLFPGSGGGSTAHAGGNGGGIIYVKANSLLLSGSVLNNGETTTAIVFGGGAGAGGSVYLFGNMFTLGSDKLTATGGIGDIDVDDFCEIRSGNGGAGRIHLKSNNISGTTNPAAATSSLPMARALVPNNAGLVGYWSFEEGAGNQAGDMSGRGNNGTVSGSPTWVDGKRGKALSLNGNNQYVNVGSSSPLQITGDLSISAWINMNSVNPGGEDDEIFSRSNDPLVLAAWQLKGTQDCTNEKLGFLISGNGSNYGQRCGSTILATSTWYHVAGVYNSAALTIDVYVNGFLDNGTLLGTVPASIYNTSLPATIGIRANLVDDFDGRIDEVRVYNRALSATEVASLYQSSGRKTTINSSQNTQLTAGLVGLWSFNGADIQGSLALDRSGNGNNGTITGAIPTIGKVGQALKLDGSNGEIECVSVGAPSSLNNLSQISISAWIYAKSAGDFGRGVILNKSNFEANGWKFEFGSYRFTVDYDTRLMAYATRPSLNEWHHVVVVWNGSQTSSEVKFYTDGILVNHTSDQDGSGSRKGDQGQGVVISSMGCSSTSRKFDGKIDEVRVYDSALTAEEIKRLYNMGR